MIVLSLGSNLGDKRENIRIMEREIAQFCKSNLRLSPLYETAPVGVSNHPSYLNRVVAVEFTGTPAELLVLTQQIENQLGRTEKGKLAPRTADIDILLFDDKIVETKNLIIPHHALFDRRFEIEGVKAVVPDMEIPAIGIMFKDYKICNDIQLQELSIIEH